MRFMMLLKANEDTEAGVLPRKEVLSGMGDLMQDMAKAGVLLAADGLQPSSKGKRVKFVGGKITTVMDGPFTESKELIAGFCTIEVDTWAEVLQWSERFAQVAGEGESEIRPLYEVSEFPPEIFPPEEAAREQALRDELQRKSAARMP
jgi:hypothetical protein